MTEKIHMPRDAQPIPGRGNPEWFCHWLKGYLGAITGRDELDAFEANSIRNTLNEVIGAQPPAAPVETRDAVDVLGDPRDHCDAPRPQCSAATEGEYWRDQLNGCWDRSKSDALKSAAQKALNYIENTENELGIKLSCGDALREAMK